MSTLTYRQREIRDAEIVDRWSRFSRDTSARDPHTRDLFNRCVACDQPMFKRQGAMTCDARCRKRLSRALQRAGGPNDRLC